MIVVDTGVLLAVADEDDRWHHAGLSLLEAYRSDELILPAPVIPETGWMIGSVLGPATEAAFIASIAHGDFTVVDLTSADWRRVAELVERYADLNLGTVDAAVVATAERLKLTTIATINPRDFRVVRPRIATRSNSSRDGDERPCRAGRRTLRLRRPREQ